MSKVIELLKKTFPNLQKWAYNVSGFNQLGLYRDDCLQETPEVNEAVRRLPAHIREERDFRILRALQLNAGNKILPKEEWTTLEKDVLYLQPYLEEVKREWKEKEYYNSL